MKVAVDAKTGIPITADGNAAVGDRTAPFLHILPKLWLPYPGLDEKQEFSIWLESIKIPEIGYESHDTRFTPCRPYPNWNYVVFGCDDTRLGMYLPLQNDLPEKLTIETFYILCGDFKTAEAAHDLTIMHIQNILLEKGDIGAPSYSTERCTPVFICQAEYERVFKKSYAERIVAYGHPAHGDARSADEWLLVTDESLEPLANRYVHSSQFEDFIPHRDRKQSIHLQNDIDTHRSNAVVEAPFRLLAEAVALASEQKDWPERPEDHPAIRHLCAWWNANAEVKKDHRQAKSCQIFVRANDEDGYQDIDHQVPNFPVDQYDYAENTARIGDHFLILYMLGKDACTEDKHGSTSYLVNGEPYEVIGLSLEELVLGYETLDNLGSVSDRYSVLYQHYAQ